MLIDLSLTDDVIPSSRLPLGVGDNTVIAQSRKLERFLGADALHQLVYDLER